MRALFIFAVVLAAIRLQAQHRSRHRRVLRRIQKGI